jgi:hypothetical protein
MTPEQKQEAGKSQLCSMNEESQLCSMNEEWFVVDENGSISVARFVDDPALKRKQLVRYSFADFKRKFETRRYNDPDPRCPKQSIAEAWLDWPAHKQYDRVVFQPCKCPAPEERPHPCPHTPPDVLNLWRGFAVRPQAVGSCKRIHKHLLDVVCGGEWTLYEYLLNWMARLVQNPEKPGEVALVLRGKEGCGKSIVGRIFHRIFGQHALAVSSPKYVVGDFSAHLQDVVFLDCAEALFAGDRATASKLKAMITDPALIIERKGADPVPWPNALSFFMTSNDAHVVHAGSESRRFFVLDVSDSKCGDRVYFKALADEIDGDACGAFLHELLARDISAWEHRDFPVTDALRDQRERSLTGVLAWALDLASRGLVRTRNGSMPWRPFFGTRELYEDFSEWLLGQKYGPRTLSHNTFARDLRTLLRLHWQRRPKVSQDVPASVGDVPGFQMPETVLAFERLVKERAGLLSEEDEEEAA